MNHLSNIRKPLFLFLVLIFSLIACTSPQESQPVEDAMPQGAGEIANWSDAVRDAVINSSEIQLEAFDSTSTAVLRESADRLSALGPRLQREADQGQILVDAATGVIPDVLKQMDGEGPQMLGDSPFCSMASDAINVTESMTETAEVLAKKHALSYGNQFSWPGFIQTIWADVSADRALHAVTTGSSVANANEALTELELVNWHSDQAINFETQSWASTGEADAKNTITMLQLAKQWADVGTMLLNECVKTL